MKKEQEVATEAPIIPEPPKVHLDKIRMNLQCILSAEELAEHSQQMASAFAEVTRFEADAKAAANQFKAQITGAESKLSLHSGLVLSGKEMRDVSCEVRKDFGTGKCIITRTDTGTVVSTRDMTTAEMQLEMKLDADATGEAAIATLPEGEEDDGEAAIATLPEGEEDDDEAIVN